MDDEGRRGCMWVCALLRAQAGARVCARKWRVEGDVPKKTSCVLPESESGGNEARDVGPTRHWCRSLFSPIFLPSVRPGGPGGPGRKIKRAALREEPTQARVPTAFTGRVL
jgi:hypothetical protein